MDECLSVVQFLEYVSGDETNKPHVAACARCRAIVLALGCAGNVVDLDAALAELERRESAATAAVEELERDAAHRWIVAVQNDARLHGPEGVRRLLARAMAGSTETPRRSLALAQLAVLCCDLGSVNASVRFDAFKELAKYRLRAADDLAGALAALDDAEALVTATGDPRYYRAVLAYARASVWGDSTCAQWAKALDFLDECEPVLKECDHLRWRGARHLRAAILIRSSEYAAAADLYLELLNDASDPYSRARLSSDLAECYSRMGRPAEALPLVAHALDFFSGHSLTLPMARAMRLRGDVLSALGQHDEAIATIEAVSKIFEAACLYDDELGAELSAVRALRAKDPGANVTARLEGSYQIACALDAEQPLRSGSRRAALWSELRSAYDQDALTSDLLWHAAEYLRTIGRGDERPFTRLQ